MAIDWTLAKILATARRLSGLRSTTQVSDTDAEEIINRVYTQIMPLEINAVDLQKFHTFPVEESVDKYDLDKDIVEIFGPITLDPGGTDEIFTINFYRDHQKFFKDYPDIGSTITNQAPEAILLWENDNDATDDKDRQLWIRPHSDKDYTLKMGVIKKPDDLSGSKTPVYENWGWCLAYMSSVFMMQEFGGGDAEKINENMKFYNFHKTLIDRASIRQKIGMRPTPTF